jgi:hypothetical protein
MSDSIYKWAARKVDDIPSALPGRDLTLEEAAAIVSELSRRIAVTIAERSPEMDEYSEFGFIQYPKLAHGDEVR